MTTSSSRSRERLQRVGDARVRAETFDKCKRLRDNYLPLTLPRSGWARAREIPLHCPLQFPLTSISLRVFIFNSFNPQTWEQNTDHMTENTKSSRWTTRTSKTSNSTSPNPRIHGEKMIISQTNTTTRITAH